MNTWYEMDFKDVKDLQDGRMSKRVHNAIAVGIHNGLQMVEEHHKKKHFLRGNARNPKTHKTKITWRTGQLARSYIQYYKRGDHFGYYGSEMWRAKVLEDGKRISAKPGKALALPTQAARLGSGITLAPKYWPPGVLFRPNLPGGGKAPVLARIGKGGKLEVMFIFHKSIKVPPRPTVKKTAKETMPAFELMMGKRVAKAMEKK
jgi:hypothetical protein